MNPPTFAIAAFAPVYLSLVPRDMVSDRLGAAVLTVATPDVAEDLLDTIWHDLARTVEEHAFRAMVSRFHAFRDAAGLPDDPGSDVGLRRFEAHLSERTNREQILAGFPVLTRRLATILDNALAAYAELFEAFAADRAAMHDAGLLPDADETLVGLFGTSADLHNDNRKVVGLDLASGTKVMYKPRALATDTFVADLFAAAEPHLRHSLARCLPASLTVENRGWQQFVTPAPMVDDDQAERYYYRFGALCALLGSIGASDLHEENLLAAGEHPCLIDTETVIRPNAGVTNDSLPHLMANQLKLSVASSMLVPMANPGSVVDLNMSGVGVEGEQTSKMLRPSIADGDNDAVSVRWEPVVYRHKDNVPRVGTTASSPIDNFGNMMAGYRDALSALRDTALPAVLDRYQNMPVRCLIRSTMVYSRFLDAATHPDYLGDEGEAQRILGLLRSFPEYLDEAAARYVGQWERSGLDTGNVPYFVAPAGSRGLTVPSDAMTEHVTNVHIESPLDFARGGIDINARHSDLYHHFLMEECFGELAVDHPTGLSRHSVFAPTLEQAEQGWAPAIADTIEAIGIATEPADHPTETADKASGPADQASEPADQASGPADQASGTNGGRQLGWLGGIGPNRGAMTVTCGNYTSFHDMGGIVTFLEHAARRDPARAGAYLAADRGLDALEAKFGDLMDQVPEGVLTGSASALFTRAARLDPGQLERILDLIEQRVAAGTVGNDLGNGPAGPLMLLLARIEAGEDPLITPERLLRLRELVLSQMDSPRSARWYDVAHGDLGMRWVASRLGRVTGDRAMVEASADWLERRFGDEHQPGTPGWCNGWAGMLLTSAEIMASAGRTETLTGPALTGPALTGPALTGPASAGQVAAMAGSQLARFVELATALPATRPVDLSVCHGASGVIQSLVATARILGETADRQPGGVSLLATAESYQHRLVATARANGFHTGSVGRTSLLGYMLGWAGVGDTDLILREALDNGLRPDGLPTPVAFASTALPTVTEGAARSQVLVGR